MTPDAAELCTRLRAALHTGAGQPPAGRPDRQDRTARGRQYRLVRDFAPELSYGRHAGPAPCTARPAAVLVLLYPLDGQWHVLLTLRPTHLPTHAGQISLPGGAVDPGETAEQCAAREWTEELGTPGIEFEFVGRLAPLYVFASNYVVTPCVAVSQQAPTFSANQQEVAEVFQLPLRDLWDASRLGEHEQRRGSMVFRAPHIVCHGYRIWGATALVLGELLSVLGEGWR